MMDFSPVQQQAKCRTVEKSLSFAQPKHSPFLCKIRHQSIHPAVLCLINESYSVFYSNLLAFGFPGDQ